MAHVEIALCLDPCEALISFPTDLITDMTLTGNLDSALVVTRNHDSCHEHHPLLIEIVLAVSPGKEPIDLTECT